mgnify:FL=1
MDNPFKNPTTISFCTGLRQLDTGVERVTGIGRTAVYLEIEAFSIWNLANQMEKGLLDPAPIWVDAKTFPADRFRHKIHGIIAGYPCPGESTAGLRKLWEDERFIWPYLEQSIRAIKPVWCFFENVEGHLSGSFPIIFRHLRNLGYRVEAGIFSAREVGAPQERRRVFILAVADTFCNAAGRERGGTHRTRKADEAQAWETHRERSGFITTGSGEVVEHTSSFLCRAVCGEGGTEISITGNTGGELGNGDHPWQPQQKRNIQNKRGRDKHSNKNLGNTFGPGHEGDNECPSRGGRWISEPDPETQGMANGGYTPQFLSAASGFTTKQIFEFAREEGITLWPAGQGYYQYEYEPSRTVISALELSFNGYNFRDDLLRGIGNGVVPDVAAKAFRVLMEKHGLNHLIE